MSSHEVGMTTRRPALFERSAFGTPISIRYISIVYTGFYSTARVLGRYYYLICIHTVLQMYTRYTLTTYTLIDH